VVLIVALWVVAVVPYDFAEDPFQGERAAVGREACVQAFDAYDLLSVAVEVVEEAEVRTHYSVAVPSFAADVVDLFPAVVSSSVEAVLFRLAGPS
jgi:hypothetical protein